VQDSDFKMRQKGRVDAGKVVKGCGINVLL
jgi:hypothetical protein